jgi:hypothetical protein
MECNIHLRGIYMYRIFVKNALLEKSNIYERISIFIASIF